MISSPQPPFLTHFKDISSWLAQNCEKSGLYSIKANGQVVVDGDLRIKTLDIRHIMVDFLSVSGNFTADGCVNLRTLQGTPRQVGRAFTVNACHTLTSLLGAPHTIGLYLSCCNCAQLETLQGGPTSVASIYCDTCPVLTQLDLPSDLKINGPLYCRECPSLDLLLAAPIPVIKFNDLPTPSPEAFLSLAKQAIKFDILGSYPSWCTSLMRYYETQDTLQLMADFEELYQQPYRDTLPVRMEVPTL